MEQLQPEEGKLNRLQIIEKDTSNELVKVRYIGYDSSYDKWRPESDIVDLSQEGRWQHSD